MNTRRQMILGVILLVIGTMALLNTLLDISLGRYVFPLLFIGLGAWIIMRPSTLPEGTAVRQQLMGDVRRNDAPRDEDILVLLGDVKIDWRQAVWPDEPVHVRVTGLLGDVNITVPDGVAVSLDASALIASTRLGDRKQDGFLMPVRLVSEGYAQAAHQLEVETVHLLGDVKVRWG